MPYTRAHNRSTDLDVGYNMVVINLNEVLDVGCNRIGNSFDEDLDVGCNMIGNSFDEEIDDDSSSDYVLNIDESDESDEEPLSHRRQIKRRRKSSSAEDCASDWTRDRYPVTLRRLAWTQTSATSRPATPRVAPQTDEAEPEDEDEETDSYGDVYGLYHDPGPDEYRGPRCTIRTHPARFPPNFPRKIREMINLIPNYQLHINDEHIRQKVVDYVRDSMDPILVELIAGFLSLAPSNILQDIANIVGCVVRRSLCAGTFAFPLQHALSCYHHHHNSGFLPWLLRLSDTDLLAAMGRPHTRNKIFHLLMNHVEILAGPAYRRPFVEMTITRCPLYAWHYTLEHSEAEVRAFIKSLPVMKLSELDKGEICGICHVQFKESAKKDSPKKLPCGHFFNAKCLYLLLGPQPIGENFFELSFREIKIDSNST